MYKKAKKLTLSIFMLITVAICTVTGTMARQAETKQGSAAITAGIDQGSATAATESDASNATEPNATLSDSIGNAIVESLPLVQDISPYNFSVSPSGVYVNQVITGTGSYFKEIHNLLNCTGPEADGMAAYCIEPSRAAPSSQTPYTETGLSDSSSSTTAEKAGAAAVLMYGYGGLSSINNDIIGLPEPNTNIGGTYGLYVINGTAYTGILINGTFFRMNSTEAHALTAAVIHRINGSRITSITGSLVSSDSQIAEAADYLYSLGSYSRLNTDVNGWESTNAFLYAYTQPSRTLTLTIQRTDGEWVSLPQSGFSTDIDWTPYMVNGTVNIKATYDAFRCESRLIKSACSSGQSGMINYSHEAATTFASYPAANGCYDYISVSEGSENTAAINVSYGPLTSSVRETIRLGVIDANYGGFPPCDGVQFSQTVLISVSADELNNGRVLELNINVPEGAGHTPYYGDGDGADGSYTAGRFFSANGYQDVVVASPNTTIDVSTELIYIKQPTGKVSLTKGSALQSITTGNLSYSLAGAVYGIYSDQSDAEKGINELARLKTDAKGTAEVSGLVCGTYYIKELSPPQGYNLDKDIYTISVSADNTAAANVSDMPCYEMPHLLVYKQNEQNNRLSGAIFEANFYGIQADSDPKAAGYTPAKTWYLQSLDDGGVYLSSDCLRGGDDLYTDEAGNIILPYGTLTLQEIQAPDGYVSDDCVYSYRIDGSNTFSEDYVENNRIITNHYARQAFQIIKYGESADGDFPLSHAGFMACKLDELERDETGSYIWDEAKAVVLTATGGTELFTDENGYALSTPLIYGTYVVRETTVPQNFLAIEDFIVDINCNSDTPQEVRYFTDDSFKAYVRIQKRDMISGGLIVNNPAAFSIWSYDDEKFVTFKYTDNDGEHSITELTTDENGVLSTPSSLFPGRYGICEVTAPVGYYNETPDSFYDFEISADNMHEVYTDSYGQPTDYGLVNCIIYNTPITGQLEIYKTGDLRKWDDDIGDFITDTKPLANICFDIIAADNLYTQDNHNTLLYESGSVIETIVTDENGHAASSAKLPLGNYIIREQTPPQYEASEDIKVTLSLNDTILEHKADGRLSKSVIVTKHICNTLKIPSLATKARDNSTGTNTGIAQSHSVITDEISYDNLIPDEEYTIKGIVMSFESGEPCRINGQEITGTTTFICEDESGTAEVSFNLDSSKLSGKSIVLYEELYQGDTLVAVHTDINNSDQTITYPPETPPDTPKTGDSEYVLPLLILLAVTIITIISIRLSKNRFDRSH